MRLLPLFLLPLLALAPAAEPTIPPAGKIQTLLITGQNRHDWRAVSPVLRQMLEDTKRFEVRIVEEFRGATDDMLKPYDLVILNYENKRLPELRWTESSEKALLAHVRRGKGLVIYHFTLAGFEGWTDFEKLCGGNWRPNNGHHSARHDFQLTIQDGNHPITKGMKAKIPIANDELYANLQWQQPKDKYHVLATAWDDHALYNGKARQPIPGAGLDHPMLWVNELAGGRVFVTALGHDLASINQAGFIATFVRGAEWAATGVVTIPVPPELQQ
jgi:type 1 glutamine amidotransferase